MAEYNKLEAKVEAAIAAVIVGFAGLAGEKLFVSHAAEKLTVPSTEVESRLGPEVVTGSGVFNVLARVTVRSSADVDGAGVDPEPEHRNRVGLVRDACLQDTVVDLLNAAGIEELTVLDVFYEAEGDSHGKDSERRHLVDSLGLRIVAANAAI
jgi:hypothetical protein